MRASLRTPRTSRLTRRYRVMWDQNCGLAGFYNPPISADRLAQATFGFLAGRPVDAYVGAPGVNAGYNLSWPTEIDNAEFIVDRMRGGARIGEARLWRHAENLRRLWEAGIDPLQVEVEEAKRLGIDHWMRLSMNDWHHWGDDVRGDRGGHLRAVSHAPNLQSSTFYESHPEYLIGEEGAKGWSGELAKVLPWFQDFAHEEVRALRRDIAVEACTRYDLAGFCFDFMRCPGYFKYGEEDAGAELMNELMRQTRTALDGVGDQRGRPVGLTARVPTTIDGARRLSLDVAAWIAEDLVDIVVPSCFFAQDMEQDVSEWVELASGSGVRICPAIEEAHMAGHASGFRRWYVKPPMMTPLQNEMLRGLAARHWRNGADGIYLFNFFGTACTYDYDNRDAVDDMADPLRLEHKSKIYALSYSHDSFLNCLQTERQIPAHLDTEKLNLKIDIADNLRPVRDRLHSVSLWLHLENLTVDDEIAVELNGAPIPCANPKQPGGFDPNSDTWLCFDLFDTLPVVGSNTIAVRLTEQNQQLADELPVEIVDVELEVRYDFPDGEWRRAPGWFPRTL